MKYMLLIHCNEQAWTEAERQECFAESQQLQRELEAEGRFLAASPLQPAATSMCVKVRQGKRHITDGPFAETHEQIGGYFLIEAADLSEAVSVAERIPAARKGTVEVRPLFELAGTPAVPTVAEIRR